MSDDITIDKGILIPAKRESKLLKNYPVEKMAIGDSFFLPGAIITHVSPRMHRYAVKYNFKFTSRSIDGGVRVWRIG